MCATVSVSGTVSYDSNAFPDPLNPGTCVTKQGKLAKSVPFAPKAAVLAADRYMRMTGNQGRLRAALFSAYCFILRCRRLTFGALPLEKNRP